MLNSNNVKWYSYEEKQQIPLRVVTKLLYTTCNPKSIKEDLKRRGIKILDVINTQSRTTEPLRKFI